MPQPRFLLPALAGFLACTLSASAQTTAQSVDADLPSLLSTYKDIHSHPELSHHEERTSALLSGDLRKLGYDVTERVGRYEDGSQAYGVVAILKNGSGPQLLVRADMDALPVEEKTGLPYASHVRGINAQGADVPVMHACGHDIHVTVLLGFAKQMIEQKSAWHGTLMLIGQPSEETIDGARAMLADHLYERFGKPDFILSEHDASDYPTGSIAIKPGPLAASSTSIDVVMRGKGGHGAAPELTKDPVLMAAEFIVQLQTVVSRQIDPQQPAVITVGQIHGGTKRNIIPDEVSMGLTMRAYDETTRLAMIEDLKRIANGIAIGYGVPEDRMPIVTVSQTEITPATLNDPALEARLHASAVKALGAAHVLDASAFMGSEDVGVFRLNNTIPGVMFALGASDPDKLAAAHKAGTELPGPHSALFAPVPEPTIRTGVTAMTAMAIGLLQPKA
ncbi:amidohydrolase [Silvibacterium dinghuense]|uniref:Amidohydrolase n=1 Tax=Silvibacterium dinghuense TaxID=1560006 RepID=A0A4V1NVW8_9BACT|nr:amidohydrolase [Silvibacterium dinghuense]RXS97372.1 amidohydrolase [Silvibacterium dinghuense]GGG98457.1 putative amidohydrolase [Silvibacterium dinghuense]